MASPLPPRKNGAAPSAAWLVCAACGPLSERLAALTGIRFAGEAGLVHERRCFEAESPVPYPRLRLWVEADAAVKEALDAVESARSRASRRDSPTPSYPELAGRARAALLRGRGKLFNSCYQAYANEHPYEWHPDRSHGIFWERVLGPGWEGSEFLPAGKAREEFAFLAGNVLAFSSQPKRGLPVPQQSEMLAAAAALRRADGRELAKLAEGGSRSAAAALLMLQGRAGEAARAFEQLFGRSGDMAYSLELQGAMPLLTYALICGVLAGGRAAYLRVWFGHLRGMVLGLYPEAMEKQQGTHMRLLDHLELIDALLNRKLTALPPPRPKGPLSLLPFAMAYGALPQYLRAKLPADRLAAAVDALAREGQPLLAGYGALGLLHAAPQLDREVHARLHELAAALNPAFPPAYAPVAERALLELQKLAEQGGGERLAWDRDAAVPTVSVSRTELGAVFQLGEGSGSNTDTPLLACMRQYANHGLLVLEGASPAGLTRLCLAMLPQLEVQGSLAALKEEVPPAQAQPVLCVARAEGTRFVAALRLRLLPGALPLFPPACGLHEPVVVRGQEEIALRRDFAAERDMAERVHATLNKAFPSERLHRSYIELDGLDELAALLELCRREGIECCRGKGQALHLHRPQGGLTLVRGEDGGWLEAGAGLAVDEGRVLDLETLLAAYAQREGDLLCIGEGEYVQLNDTLLRQLALLELTSQEKKGKRLFSPATLPLLEALAEVGTSPAAPVAPAALPAGLNATLRPYQQVGYAWLAERAQKGLGAILADDMGLGKTVQILALLLHEGAREQASLVITPVSLLGNWAAEVARFAPGLKLVTYDPRTPECLDAAGAGSLVLASYGQVAARLDAFAGRAWNVLVLDEAQAIKNAESLRAKAVCSLNARARFCLTGTPIENSLLDLWSEMHFLNPGLLGARAAFSRRFKRAGEVERDRLRRVLAPLVLRRTKQEVLAQLPPLTEMVEWVEFSHDERALYEGLRRSAVEKLGAEPEGGKGRMGILAELTRLRRACCHGKLALDSFGGASAKLAALAELVGELREAGHKVLVFSQFTDVLDIAEETLEREGVTCLRMDGSTPAAQRADIVRDFQEGGADAFLISLKSGGVGLNLTAADYVILLDPWWNPAVEAQAAGRSHRLGQRRPVTLCRLIVRDTLEERVLEMQRGKTELAESILSGTGEALGLDTLRNLLGAPPCVAQQKPKLH